MGLIYGKLRNVYGLIKNMLPLNNYTSLNFNYTVKTQKSLYSPTKWTISCNSDVVHDFTATIWKNSEIIAMF